MCRVSGNVGMSPLSMARCDHSSFPTASAQPHIRDQVLLAVQVCQGTINQTRGRPKSVNHISLSYTGREVKGTETCVLPSLVWVHQ